MLIIDDLFNTLQPVWSARLGGDNYGPFLSWLTAWWSWAGWLFTFPAMCHNATTFLVSAIMILNPDYDNALWKQFLLDCVWAITTTAMNVISEDFMKWFYRLSSGLNLFVFLLFLTWLPAKVPKWQSGSIMLQFNDYTGATQYFGSEANAKAYVWLIALLFPAWTFYGYDASAHVAEETENAAKTASRGMYTAVGVAFIGSFALLLLLLFSIQDLDEIISYQYPQPIATLFVQTVGREGAATFMVFLFLVSWSCTVACAMSISRITYAVSRDQILPFSKYWHHMSAAKMPVRAQWLCCALTIILLLPVVGSPIAFYALASTATIAVDTSYIIPILGKLTVGRASFKPGEWNLGKLSVPLGIFVCIWISLLFVCLCLPQLFVPLNEEGTVYGVTAQVFNCELSLEWTIICGS